MNPRILCLVLYNFIIFQVNSAAIDNSILSGTTKILNTESLISNIVNECFEENPMHCLNEKVITFLDTLSNTTSNEGRNLNNFDADSIIFDRIGRVLETNEFQIQLPATFFQNAIISYRADKGFDMKLSKNEGRGHLQKKLILPLLLLMKFKLKTVIPILMTLIGLKAFKALILSKIAIKLVLGFIIYQLFQKIGGLKMNMTPLQADAIAYNYPLPTTPSAPYESSWESSGPYSRVWEPSNGSAQNMAYNSYHPANTNSISGSSSNSNSAGGSSSGSAYTYST